MVSETASVDRSEMTWIRDYRDVQEVLKSSAFVPSLHLRSSAPLLQDTLMTLGVDDHLRRRRTEVVMFSRAQLMEYELGIIAPALRESLGRAVAESSGDGPIKADILKIMRDALLRVTAMIVGLDGVDSMEATEELRELAEFLGEGASAEWARADREAIVAASLAAKERFSERFFLASMQRREELVAAFRRGELAEEDLPNDLTTILLKSYDSWDTEMLIREIIFFIVASSSTTTHSAPHVLRDILTWFDKRPEDREKAGDLSFLQRAVSESLRLHPTVPALLRLTREDVTLPSGRSFAAGEQVACDLDAANGDADVFGPTAGEYDPYRPIPHRTPAYGEAFGDGAHTCLGRQVAVGAGNGSIDRPDVPAGVLVRLLEEVFKYSPRLDPEDPPIIRDDTAAVRYKRFQLILEPRSEAADQAATGCPIAH